MPNNNDDRKLLLYISISIVVHFLIIYFLPIGFLHGSAQSESELNDYGYVQMVDYQPAPVEEETAVEEVEPIEEPPAEEPEEIAEVEEVEPEETVEAEVEEMEASPETEASVEEEIAEVEPSEPETAAEPVKEEIEDAAKEPDSMEVEQVEPETEPVPEPETEVEEAEEEIMASQESESEVEIVQETDNSENDAQSEESSTAAKDDTAVEESASDSEETAAEISDSEEVESSTEVEETAPPPPPTAGDLIGLIEPPTFPKDLVGSRSEGTVRLMVEISPGGTVNNIEVTESSGYDSMDRVAQLTLEHGWQFKEYQQAYRIPVSVRYYIDQSDNSQVEVDIGQVDFITGGE